MKPHWYKSKCKKCNRFGWTAGYCPVCGTLDPNRDRVEILLDWLDETARQVKKGEIEVRDVHIESVLPENPDYAYLYHEDMRKVTVHYVALPKKKGGK